MSIQLRSITSIPVLKCRVRNACALVALVTVLAFIALVSLSVTHFHSTVHETQDCSICSVVSDKTGSGCSAPAIANTQFVVLFALASVVLRSALVVSALPLPPACGPPSLF